MKIIRVVIQNYRSIKSIAFNPTGLTAFVGPNNAGKTNILSALHFLLGERFPMPAGLDIRDRLPFDILHTVVLTVITKLKFPAHKVSCNTLISLL